MFSQMNSTIPGHRRDCRWRVVAVRRIAAIHVAARFATNAAASRRQNAPVSRATNASDAPLVQATWRAERRREASKETARQEQHEHAKRTKTKSQTKKNRQQLNIKNQSQNKKRK